MASGLPIITTDNGGSNILVKDGENGFVTERGSAEKLADAMAKVMKDDDLREKMGTCSIDMTEKHFDKKVVEKSFLETFRSIWPEAFLRKS